MQYLKEQVREAIMVAAINEFLNKNYKTASMRSIATNAGITVGNVYRYFSSKEEMFYHITDPVWEEVEKIIFDKYDDPKHKDLFPISKIISSIMDIYRSHNREVFILLHNSVGSKYANVKGDLVNLIEKRIKEEILQISNLEIKDEFIFHIISNSIVESIYVIMKEFGEDFDRVQALIERTITIIVKDLHHRI